MKQLNITFNCEEDDINENGGAGYVYRLASEGIGLSAHFMMVIGNAEFKGERGLELRIFLKPEPAVPNALIKEIIKKEKIEKIEKQFMLEI